ncbi:hypothetical protein F2P56_035825 [Juglans regia]|uniref:Ultraviolet-B receptor UVR8 n=1 Tax=Juglans regia TaxID=51240 RepID=A0A833TMX7_JUGRE|nr:hypothetical protein F2P56_035825 [Juglans regia]
MEQNEKANRAIHDGEEVQKIWSWGAGTDGQLGTGKLEDELLPQLLHLPSLTSSGPISLLACGGAHVIALSSGGRVLTWGRGTSGQLGHGEMVNSLYPMPVTSLQDYFITHVSAGWSHSGFVSDSGCLFTCGDGSFGQLGHGEYRSHCSPVRVSYFLNEHVKQMACGMRHSLVLLEVDGHLYNWGRGFSGSPDSHFPQFSSSSFMFTRAALGWNHALALTGDAEVFMLGGNYHGVLGDLEKMRPANQLPDSREAILEKVAGLDGVKILQIAAGAEHSAVVTENGEIKTWGWGEHGQLGLGNICDQTSPQAVSLSGNTNRAASFKVYCGSGFTFAIMHPCDLS